MKYLVHSFVLVVFLLPCALAFADDDTLTPYQQRFGASSYVQPHDSAPAIVSTPTSLSTPSPTPTLASTTPTAVPVIKGNASAQQAPTPVQTLSDYEDTYAYGEPSTPYQQRYNVPSSSVQSSDQSYQGGNKRAEINISTIYDNDPSSSVRGGSSYGLETTAYSATIDNKWRLFAGELYSHELEPEGEGHINYSRSQAGIEYSHNSLIASVAPTYNSYNGNERAGVAGNTTWTINDNWAVGGGAELFSRDIPLRALNDGITANAYNAVVDWYQEGRRDVRLNGDVMTFSDNNLRTSVGVNDTEHLYASRHFTFDGLGSVVESNNSENEDRSYFNPRQDVLTNIGGRLGQPLYKGQGFAYDHSLEVKPGVYWQENYGTSGALSAGYTQHVNYRGDIDGSAGLIFTRQSADGVAENDLAVLLNLAKKF